MRTLVFSIFSILVSNQIGHADSGPTFVVAANKLEAVEEYQAAIAKLLFPDFKIINSREFGSNSRTARVIGANPNMCRVARPDAKADANMHFIGPVFKDRVLLFEKETATADDVALVLHSADLMAAAKRDDIEFVTAIERGQVLRLLNTGRFSKWVEFRSFATRNQRNKMAQGFAPVKELATIIGEFACSEGSDKDLIDKLQANYYVAAKSGALKSIFERYDLTDIWIEN